MKPLVIALLATLGAAVAAPDAKPGAAEAEKRAAAWIEALPEAGLVLDERLAVPGFVGRTVAGSGNTMFVLRDGPWWITLGFTGRVTGDAPLDELKEKFSYIALDRLPTPGLDLPGWEVVPRTPTSSIPASAGAVEILAAGEGRITLRVRTRFFALHGTDPAVVVPADAPAPPGSFFQVRQRFQLDLRLDAPFGAGN